MQNWSFSSKEKQPMAAPIFGITDDTARLGMDVLALRQSVIARNLAHVDVPGAQPLQLRFADFMRAAADAAPRDAQWLQRLENAARSVRTEPDAQAALNPALLDSQVVKLNEVTLHYQAVANALNRHLATLSLAVNEGRRA